VRLHRALPQGDAVATRDQLVVRAMLGNRKFTVRHDRAAVNLGSAAAIDAVSAVVDAPGETGKTHERSRLGTCSTRRSVRTKSNSGDEAQRCGPHHGRTNPTDPSHTRHAQRYHALGAGDKGYRNEQAAETGCGKYFSLRI
jgi:hypothetical protein